MEILLLASMHVKIEGRRGRFGAGCIPQCQVKRRDHCRKGAFSPCWILQNRIETDLLRTEANIERLVVALDPYFGDRLEDFSDRCADVDGAWNPWSREVGR